MIPWSIEFAWTHFYPRIGEPVAVVKIHSRNWEDGRGGSYRSAAMLEDRLLKHKGLTY